MKTTNQEELFANLREFLKGKGIELQEGSYTRTVQKGCQVLADIVNLSQQAVGRAKAGVEEQLEHVRQVLHEKTAPRKPPIVSQPPPQGGPGEQPPPPPPPFTSRARKPRKTSRKRSPGQRER